jgi:8-oxo-dGTP pyrophosphatase MutT (NUDIX family)
MAPHDASRKPVDQAAAVCYRRVGESVEFKLVRTTKGGRWVFPKGHIEKGEEPWRTAQREALEEAGVRGPVESEPLAVFPHEKHKQDGRRVELTIAAYLLHVESDSDRPKTRRKPPPAISAGLRPPNRRSVQEIAGSRLTCNSCQVSGLDLISPRRFGDLAIVPLTPDQP